MNSQERLRVALVGCGRVGTRTTEQFRRMAPPGWVPFSHAEAILTTKNLVLDALCDVDQDKLSWAGATYQVEKLYRDYKTMICDVQPDILAVATRTPGRCKIIEFAAEHGVKGIHAEKPFSLNMAEARRALDAVIQNDIKLSYGTSRRYRETYRRAKALVNSGRIGDLVEVAVEHGRTTLMWNHPHSVDLLLFFANCLNFEYIHANCCIHSPAVSSNLIDEDPILEHAFVKFANGVNGIVTSAAGMNTRISGTSGQLVVVADGSWIEIRQKAERDSPYYLTVEKIEVPVEMSVTQRIFFELEAAVRANTPVSIQPDEIAISQNMLLSCVFSSLQGGININPAALNEDFTVTGKLGALYA